jgi:CBS domain-containing protein
MKVRDLMTSNPACCTPGDPIERAALLMEQNDCGCIPIVESADSSCVVGVITDRDIAVRGVGHGIAANTAVRDVMTASPFCCTAEADVHEVEQIMADRQVRRVVVVDDAGCCVGMVAQADLARAAERNTDITDDEFAHVVERISEPARQAWSV